MDASKINERRAALVKELQEMVQRSEKDGKPLSAEDKTRFDAAEKEAVELKETIERSSRIAPMQADLDKFTPAVPPAQPNLDLKQKDKEKYSLMRAIRLTVEHKPLDGIEGELSAEITRQTGAMPKGFWFPSASLDYRPANREISRAFDLTSGSKLITQTWMSFIDALRNKSILAQVGATYLTGLVGLVDIPLKSATTSGYWVAEGSAPTISNPTITSQRQLSPKLVGAYSDITRSLLQQSSYDVEMMVRDDLVTTVALELDNKSINGSGASNQPTGLLANATSSAYTLAANSGNGDALTWPDIVGMETAVGGANVDTTNAKYLTNSKVRGKLKTTAKIGSTFPDWIWEKDNTINGYPSAVSNALLSNSTLGTGTGLSTLIYGDFSNLVVGMWGAMDVTVDPYALSTSGGIRLIALQNVDMTIRHPEAFAYSKYILTT